MMPSFTVFDIMLADVHNKGLYLCSGNKQWAWHHTNNCEVWAFLLKIATIRSWR
jgi:hypothetical protein